MQTLFVKQSSSKRLIAVFLGWAMDGRSFMSLNRPGYDIVLVWDYTSAQLDVSQWLGYEEICVIAWSMGVYFSALIPDEIEAKVTRRIAVNGTLTPMHDELGIPKAVFMGTLQGLNPRNLEKFYFRVCGSRELYQHFQDVAPQRDIEELRKELAGMVKLPAVSVRFDVAVVGMKDAIFPPRNQIRAWKETPTELKDWGHYPDFQSIIDTYIIDKDRVAHHFGKSVDSYENGAVVQQDIVQKLCRQVCGFRCDHVLEVGSGTGLLSRKIKAELHPREFEMWDICDIKPFPEADFKCADAETAITEVGSERFDLIISASAIQWFNSPAQFIKNSSRALKAGGHLAIGTFLRGNLKEITDLIPNSLPLMTMEQWMGAVPSEMSLEHCESWETTLLFDTPMAALKHLKETGVNSLGRQGGAVASARGIIERYKPDENGKWNLTYCPVILILKKNETTTES